VLRLRPMLTARAVHACAQKCKRPRAARRRRGDAAKQDARDSQARASSHATRVRARAARAPRWAVQRRHVARCRGCHRQFRRARAQRRARRRSAPTRKAKKRRAERAHLSLSLSDVSVPGGEVERRAASM